MIANIAGDLYHAMPADQRPTRPRCSRASGRRWACRPNRSTSWRRLRSRRSPGAADASGTRRMDGSHRHRLLVREPGRRVRGIGGVGEPVLRRPRDPAPRDGAVQRLPRRQLRAVHRPRLARHDPRLRRPRLVGREMERMRGRGSRAYFVWATPFEGRSPAHPAADRFWRASTDLGMVAVLHIGNTPAHFAGGWADAGWDEPERRGHERVPALREQPAHRGARRRFSPRSCSEARSRGIPA